MAGAAAALALAGCGGQEPARDTSPSATFAVIGDFGVGRARERALGAAVQALHPDVLVTVGDNNYASPRSFRANWRESFSWAENVVAALGNHDVEAGGGRYEFPILHMPARFYSKRIDDVELIVLDSNDVDAEQTAFLERRLRASTATWRIPVFHHPPYLCGAEQPSIDVRRAWVPLFRRYGVKLVLSGHDHDYERFVAGRITYVVDGGGAADLYPLRPCKPGTPPLVASNQREHTFLLLTISSLGISAEVHSVATGDVVDRFKIFP